MITFTETAENQELVAVNYQNREIDNRDVNVLDDDALENNNDEERDGVQISPDQIDKENKQISTDDGWFFKSSLRQFWPIVNVAPKKPILVVF